MVPGSLSKRNADRYERIPYNEPGVRMREGVAGELCRGRSDLAALDVLERGPASVT